MAIAAISVFARGMSVLFVLCGSCSNVQMMPYDCTSFSVLCSRCWHEEGWGSAGGADSPVSVGEQAFALSCRLTQGLLYDSLCSPGESPKGNRLIQGVYVCFGSLLLTPPGFPQMPIMSKPVHLFSVGIWGM